MSGGYRGECVPERVNGGLWGTCCRWRAVHDEQKGCKASTDKRGMDQSSRK